MIRTTSYLAFEHIPEAFRDFMGKRVKEASGLGLMAVTIALGLALASWSIQDPSFNHATSTSARNLLGFPGAAIADLVMQLFGISAVAIFVPTLFWAIHLVSHKTVDRFPFRLLLMAVGLCSSAVLTSLLPQTDRWPLPSGLGGLLGDAILTLFQKSLGNSGPVTFLGFVCFAAIAILSLSASAGFIMHEPEDVTNDRQSAHPMPVVDDDDLAGEPGIGIISLGALIHGFLRVRGLFRRMFAKRSEQESLTRPSNSTPLFFEPTGAAIRLKPAEISKKWAAENPDEVIADEVYETEPQDAEPDKIKGRVSPRGPTIRGGKRAIREAQPSLLDQATYELPPLAMLSEPRKQAVSKISEDALEQNARLLEGVLDDFGVKGEIINVRPGPVVTLYELEPAPGIKSSRVIGLADDIARSMSAISARVAVVQGRNAIGVELPNQKRETVFLRELIASAEFEGTKHKLAIALGKTIGGEPVIVDLAKMPHLLVAGTTGSGKSVAINTMILSLLYRLVPDQCRLIMIDPKMLELSVYDGIPHLLTPVVTDPKKAVVALKWAVREMEDRYKKMSKIGVRNIDGFNVRVAEARAKGEVISRTVQTGYNRETGEATYEQEQMNLDVLPYIVVIVDEMADLMMVAGKDIEGAIQRLAQMARAAGIHLIMATQRPSVDVITGTIKANFPTRISFQVTSKIDSRTILGEQGAEQLLGQGDMLYMAGGGRISRVHGPFVSDNEVEKIVAHLKTQGQPEYLEAITADDEDEDGDLDGSPGYDGDEPTDLYDKAVAIVLRDRKCSTSYIQRRLAVGYNKAATLVERMEKEGVVGSANHAGKRTILVGGGVDRGAFELPVE